MGYIIGSNPEVDTNHVMNLTDMWDESINNITQSYNIINITDPNPNNTLNNSIQNIFISMVLYLIYIIWYVLMASILIGIIIGLPTESLPLYIDLILVVLIMYTLFKLWKFVVYVYAIIKNTIMKDKRKDKYETNISTKND